MPHDDVVHFVTPLSAGQLQVPAWERISISVPDMKSVSNLFLPQVKGRSERSQQAHRIFHVSGTHWCRKDRARKGSGRALVQYRRCDGPLGHERVHGEAHRKQANRCPARLRRLRRGRTTHGGCQVSSCFIDHHTQVRASSTDIFSLLALYVHNPHKFKSLLSRSVAA